MKVFVIIVTFNPLKWIELCLNSLTNSSIPLNVIVIDNGSTDGSQNIISKNYPEIELIQSEQNLGFGKANNIGISKAIENGADYVFLLNQDAWVDKNTIEGLVKFLNVNIDFGIVSPLHFCRNKRDFDLGFLHFCSQEKIMESHNVGSDFINVSSINGAFMMISKNCAHAIKGFDPIFQFYGEDVDLCNRAKKKGFKIAVLNSFRGFHDRGERIMTDDRLFNHLKANQLVQIKSGNKLSFLIIFISSIYSVFYLALIRLIRFDFNVFFLYIKTFFFLVLNYNSIKNSYYEYN